MLPDEQLKRCPKCTTEKPRGEFHRNKSRADGLQGYCKDCWSESTRRYRLGNPAAHRAAVRKSMAKARAADPTEANAKANVYTAKRRSVKLAAPQATTQWERQEIARMYDWLPYISEMLGTQMHVAHLIPLARGGSHTLDNLEYLPAVVNLSQGDRLIEECTGIAREFFDAPYSYETN